MRAGAVVRFDDHEAGPKGKRMRQPALPGKWSVWSQLSTGPGHHAVQLIDDVARATGVSWATAKITDAAAVGLVVTLVATEPAEAMPRAVKVRES